VRRDIRFYYIFVWLFYSTGQRSLLDAVFYSIGLRCLYVIFEAIQVFSIFKTVEKIKINDISVWNPELNKKAKASKASYAWLNIAVHCLCEIIIQNWIRFNLSKHVKGPVSSIELLKTSFQ